MKRHIEVFRVEPLAPVEGEIVKARGLRFGRRLRIVAPDGTVTVVPWSVISRVKITRGSER